MKTRILSALAVLTAVAALSACGGKGANHTGAGTAPAGAVVTSGGPAAPQSSAGGRSGSDGTSDPNGDLNSLDQQLSGVDGALDSAAQTATDDNDG